MTTQDDVRRLSQMGSIYLGWSVPSPGHNPVTGWFKGRLQQANDGNWIFRSISSDGSLTGFQLGNAGSNWSSNETPADGITIVIQLTQTIMVPSQPGAPMLPPVQFTIAIVYLQEDLPAEVIN